MDPALNRTPWPTQLQADLEAAEAIFVVGYSLGDFHIARLLRSTPALVRKTFIVLEPTPSAALCAYAADFGAITPMGFSGLASELTNFSFDPSADPGEAPLVCFEEYRLPDVPSEPTTEDVAQLIITGGFNDHAELFGSLHPKPPYTIQRRRALGALARRGSDGTRLLIHAKVGNGKTIFLRQLALRLSQAGLYVIFARHPADIILTELDRLRHIVTPKAYIFDRLRGFSAAIRNVSQNLLPTEYLIVTGRTSDVSGDFSTLSTAVGEGFTRVDLNALIEAELRDLDIVLDYYGLWGPMAGRASYARIKFIKDQCGGELRSVILFLFKESRLGERVRDALIELSEFGGDPFVVFASLLISRLADCPLDFYDICEIADCDPNVTRDALGQHGGLEFLQAAEDSYSMQSAVLAEFALANVIPPDVCLNSLVRMVESLTILRTADWRYEESMPKLLRFSILSKIFSAGDRRPFIVGFYEKMLSIGFLRSNPQFWLQYAMARMERKEFNLADRCLQSAYAAARKLINYKTYMIDNQRIRFLLQSRLHEMEFPDFEEAIRLALPLLDRQANNMGRSLDIHVLRLAEPIRDFRLKFFARLSKSGREMFERSIGNLTDRVLGYGGEGVLQEDERHFFRMLRL